jgi:hypothetical protein
VSSDKAQKSKMASMAAWLKTNGGENCEAVTSRGDQRRKYLEAFLVHDLRSRTKTKTIETVKTKSTTDDDVQDHYWWSQEQMDKELGPEKSADWRTSQKLATRPDMLTGKDVDPFREYKVPRHMTRHAIGDHSSHSFKSTGVADEQYLALFFDMDADGATQQESVAIKVEPKSTDDILAEQVKALKMDPKPAYRKIQDYMMQAKEIFHKCDDIPYAEKLGQDCGKHITKLKGIIKILDQMIAGQEYDDKQLPKLIKAIELADLQHMSIEKWSVKFGLMQAGKKRKQK